MGSARPNKLHAMLHLKPLNSRVVGQKDSSIHDRELGVFPQDGWVIDLG